MNAVSREERPLYVVHGTSGATIIVHRDTAHKYAHDPAVVSRVIEQARWLKQHSDVLGLPQVIGSTATTYTMPRLYPPKLSATYTATQAVLDVYDMLNVGLWRRPTGVRQDLTALREYVTARVSEWLPMLGVVLIEFIDRGGLVGCTSCDTHGDPTLDNLMCDAKGQLVIIDPLPANERVPTLKAVDLGKLLQSAFGYELVKHQDARWSVNTETVLNYIKQRESEVDSHAALFFCAVHYLRLLPYQTNEVKRETYRKITAALCARV